MVVASDRRQDACAVHARLQRVATGSVTDRRFRPEEKLTGMSREQEIMEFLYRDGDTSSVMNPVPFEQVPVLRRIRGLGERLRGSGSALHQGGGTDPNRGGHREIP